MNLIRNKPGGLMIFGLFMAGFFFTSCDHSYFETDQLPDYQYSPVFAVPLVRSVMTIEDMVSEEERELFYYDEDNLVTLIYKDQLYSPYAGDLLSIPNQEFQTTLSIDPLGKASNHTFSERFTLDVEGEIRLDSIVFDNGILRFESSASNLVEDGFELQIQVRFPGSRNNLGNELTFVSSLGELVELDLEGYAIILTYDEQGDNQVLMEYELNVAGNGNPVNAPYQVEMLFSFKDLEFEKIFGYLGQQTLSFGSRRIPLGIFSNFLGGTLEFAQPKIQFRVNNSFGFPVDLVVNQFSALGDGFSEDITGYPNPIAVGAPLVAQIGQTITTLVELNPDNSNIRELMSMFPNEIIYDLVANLNPDDSPDNFAYNQSQLALDMEVVLPLYGLLKGARMNDTLDLDLGNDMEDIEWIELNIDVTNGFPLDARVQIQFLDENNNMLFELFENDLQQAIVESGDINAQGVVSAPRHKNTKIKLEEEKVTLLGQTSRVVVSAYLDTSNQGSTMVKIFSDYTIDIGLGARVQANKVVTF